VTVAAEPLAAPRTWRETARLYVEITRPKVMGLVLVTALPALALGHDGWPPLGAAAFVLIGTALAGGASSALNAYFERETDARMARTRRRPLPAAMLLPYVVLAYGCVLTVLSSIVLAWAGGTLAALVGLATIAFYVGVYTLWLKPRTPQNIVIGGAAGGTAPLIASAAMTGEITLGAWVLFAIIFLWTPPHFWAIAISRKSEYAQAGFPMMPIVIGDQPTRWRSLGYGLALVATTLVPVWLGDLGWIYGATALGLGAWFVGEIATSLVRQDPAVDRRVFRASVAYLFFLFVVMLVDLAAF
jgi:protoheme IX farnesyltransferase